MPASLVQSQAGPKVLPLNWLVVHRYRGLNCALSFGVAFDVAQLLFQVRGDNGLHSQALEQDIGSMRKLVDYNN